MRTLEKLSERLKDGTRDIDSRVAHISQTATRIGDRLQVRPAAGTGQTCNNSRLARGPAVHTRIPQGLHSSSSSSASTVCRQGCSALEEHERDQATPPRSLLLRAVPCCAALQTAEAVRLRCLEAQELICHLQTFSCHSAGSDFSKLPSIFTNDATLAEAAVSGTARDGTAQRGQRGCGAGGVH